jgi:hypothetical protein
MAPKMPHASGAFESNDLAVATCRSFPHLPIAATEWASGGIEMILHPTDSGRVLDLRAPIEAFRQDADRDACP